MLDVAKCTLASADGVGLGGNDLGLKVLLRIGSLIFCLASRPMRVPTGH